jgi:hypothetical protein
LGALQVAKAFSWDIRAIYAFIQSAEGMAAQYGKNLVYELCKTRFTNSLHLGAYFDMNLSRQGFDGLHADIFVAHVLDHFAVEHAQGSGLHPKLINHRFELLSRILNAAESYTPPHESPAHTITYQSFGIAETQIENFYISFCLRVDNHVRHISTGESLQMNPKHPLQIFTCLSSQSAASSTARHSGYICEKFVFRGYRFSWPTGLAKTRKP